MEASVWRLGRMAEDRQMYMFHQGSNVQKWTGEIEEVFLTIIFYENHLLHSEFFFNCAHPSC